MPRLRDSRRLPGPNLISAVPGAVVDATCAEAEIDAFVAAWEKHARRMLDAVGWGNEQTVVRNFRGGASLFLSAPIDGLYAATEVNEWAYDTAKADLGGRPLPDLDKWEAKIRVWIAEEANPAMIRLADAARTRGLLFLSDRYFGSVGAGTGVKAWPIDELPPVEAVDWDRVHDIPIALVTGTNGKSTTVRVVSAMVEAAGKVPGCSSTDGVHVGEERVERGDFSGPEGARRVLRDERVDVAVLETARGGMLRRGLGVPRADVAAVLNVAEDHLGEFGVHSLQDLIDTKLSIRRAVSESGRLVLNFDDPALNAWMAKNPDVSADGFSREGRTGETSAWTEDGTLILGRGEQRDEIAALSEIPMTLDGAAAYNVSNALAAVLIGAHLGLSVAHLRQGLLAFVSDSAHNPGRANHFEIDGVHVLVDYAHNPHGLEALFETVARMDASRTLVMLGQAGDRSDEAIRDLARIAWRTRPDHFVVKEVERLLRGREPGEISDLIVDELALLGASPETITRTDSEVEAVRWALEWAEPGDLLLLLVHDDRAAVLDALGVQG
jgi:UDP-N-acetylmuramyl tripeptide synthase